MHTALSGQGDRTVIFIHGFGGFGGLWKWQVEYFSQRMKVLTVDLPGHGHSPWVSADLNAMADDIVEILGREGLSSAHVIASSFGGLVALALWQRAPQCMASLTMTGALPKFVGTADFPAGLSREGIRTLAAQFGGDVGKVLDMFVRSFSTMQERESPQYARVKALRKEAIPPQREALLAFLNILETVDLREALQSVRVPLQFVTGDGDYLCPPQVMAVLHSQLPQARFDTFKNGGHGVFLTMPDQFNQVVGDFLNV